MTQNELVDKYLDELTGRLARTFAQGYAAGPNDDARLGALRKKSDEWAVAFLKRVAEDAIGKPAPAIRKPT